MKKNISIKYEKVKSILDFENKINNIESPCALNNIDFLNIEKPSKNSYNFPLKVFQNI